MSSVESLTKQASEITMYDVKSAVNKAKAMVLNLSEIETKVREATNDDAWGASSTVMQEIAQDTFNFQLFNEIMPTIYGRFTEKEARQWRQIYKALVLLEYLVKNGSERVIDDARTHLSLIKVLRNFHYTDENGKDQGINVRNRSRELAELLSDLDKVRQERRKAKANRNKYTGVGNDGSGGGGGPSFQSASGSRYGGFGSDSFSGASGGGSGSGSGGGGRSSSFQDSSSRAADFEEYDAGDWEESDRRGNDAVESRSSHKALPLRSASKPTPSTPKPEPPKAPEVNLFDFDDDEQQAAPPAQFGGFAAPAASTEDDFDDFQSAPTPVAAAPSAHQNVFDLLKANPPSSAAPPRSSFPVASPTPSYQQAMPSYAPMQAQSRPPMQQQPSGSYSSASSRTPQAAPAAKPASDFSDLFSSFGGAPSSSGRAGGAGPKLSMGELATQARQKQLFASAGSGQGQQAQNGGGWDSLL